MTSKTIISCALTGSDDTFRINPAVPITPEQIANEAIAACEAGASIAHIHVRHPRTGAPSTDVAHYAEVVSRIRASGCPILINLTTGPGARFVPSDEDPNRGSELSTMMTPEARVQHVLELRPEICTLDVATMNFGNRAFVNVPDHLVKMAKLIEQAGVKIEIEAFDLGHIRLARHLIETYGILQSPVFQLCLGVPWGASADTESLLEMKRYLPDNARWSAFGISRAQFPIVAQSVILGGNVRVGLEDNLYLAKGELAPGNASLVKRAVSIVRSIGAEVATPDEARSILGIAPRKQATV
ncbi:3-keto-5-aminohexanoate cleavage protein [Paraburkholderia sp. C35]|uniref:3-keto-5-aminohexanoate cleavage protein n=1 Tax=Paraburkholderia sp. C35 TaxID=2126993 RepID=UPI000D68BBFA|nr:3-keto-5-aminohexanoate cleavage protein [Paraburkholderia sp. C35]